MEFFDRFHKSQSNKEAMKFSNYALFCNRILRSVVSHSVWTTQKKLFLFHFCIAT